MLSLLRAKRGVSIVGLWLVTVTQATASPPHKTKPQTVDPAQATEPAVPPFRYEGPLGPALSLLRQGKPQQAGERQVGGGDVGEGKEAGAQGDPPAEQGLGHTVHRG